MQGAQEDTNPELAHIMKILRSIQQPKKTQLVATDNQLQTLSNNKGKSLFIFYSICFI